MIGALGGPTLLLVEDDRALQRAWAEALTDAGFSVLAERDGDWSLRTFSQRPVDLVILDVLLPGRGGLEVAEELRRSERGRDLPIVICTGLANLNAGGRGKRELAERLGGSQGLEWLDKPFAPSKLVAVCQRLLRVAPEQTDPETRRKRRDRARMEARLKDLSSIADLAEAKGVESESQVRFRGAQLVRGNLRETPFAEVLSQLHRWRATGALLLREGQVKKIVYLKEGAPLFVRSNLLGECLGQILVRERMISVAECETSLRRMQEEKRQQGTVLIEMGCISPANLGYSLQLQQETKLFDLFHWAEGDYNFNPRVDPPASLVALESTSAKILFDGIQRAYDLPRAKAALGDVDQMAVRLSDDPLDRFQEMGLEAEHARFYSLIDGRRPVRELLAPGGPLPEDEGRRLLYALKCANMVQFGLSRTAVSTPRAQRPAAHASHAGIAEIPVDPYVPPPPTGDAHERLPERALPEPELQARQQVERLAARAQDLRRGTLYEALGVTRAASEQEIRDAWSAKAKEHHPDRLGPDASAEATTIAEEIFAAIVQAHDILTDPKRRAAYEADLRTGAVRSDSDDVARILAAEERFRRGEALLKQQEPQLALTAFVEAVRLYPDEAEFHACLGWATWLCSQQDDAGEDLAEVHLLKALALNPRMDRAYVYRGFIRKALGRFREAEQEFENALLCNPASVEALRELRLSRKP